MELPFVSLSLLVFFSYSLGWCIKRLFSSTTAALVTGVFIHNGCHSLTIMSCQAEPNDWFIHSYILIRANMYMYCCSYHMIKSCF